MYAGKVGKHTEGRNVVMQFTVWLTYDCNLRCKYCYEGENKAHGKMNLDTAKNVLAFIKNKINYQHEEDDFDSIEFHGGEPLLNYEVMQYMIEEIKSWETSAPIYMSTTTNAVLLTKDKIEYLMDNLSELSVSLDGTKETHDRNRKFVSGVGSYDSIIENIEDLIKCKDKPCGLRVRMTVIPETAEYLYRDIEFLVNLGFTNIVPAMDNFSEWSTEAVDRLYQETTRVYDEIYLKRDALMLGLIDNISMRQPSVCLAGEKTMHISPDGEIYPCAYVMNEVKFKLGNAEVGILKDKVEELKKINEKKIEACSDCAWNFCCIANRCKLLNYAITGDYYKPAASSCMNEHLLLRIHKYRNKE